MSLGIDGLLIWEAINSGGQPVCVSTNQDEGLSINIYRDNEGTIRAVAVWEINGLEAELLTLTGEFTSEAAADILNVDTADSLFLVPAEELVDVFNEKFYGDIVGVS